MKCEALGPIAMLTVLVLFAPTRAMATAGFQRATVPDSDDRPRQVGIWYPSDAPASLQPLGAHRHLVAPDGDVYIGVFGNPANNGSRGFLLHFSGDLSVTKTPGEPLVPDRPESRAPSAW